MNNKRSERRFLKLFSKKDEFVWIKKNISPKEHQSIIDIGEVALQTQHRYEEELKRIYPYGQTGSHILGFVNDSGNGQSGVERGLNVFLANGKDINLSIDIDLQDPPSLIPKLVKYWKEENYDVVFTTRTNRQGEGLFKRIISSESNSISFLTIDLISTSTHDSFDYVNNYDISFLDNESFKFKKLNVIGISDNLILENQKKISSRLIQEDLFNLILVHKATLWDHVFEKTDLMLSGHTHNGQIFPFNFFVRLRYKNIYGIYEKLKSKLYVSSGSGCWGPNMRLGTKNEIVDILISRN